MLSSSGLNTFNLGNQQFRPLLVQKYTTFVEDDCDLYHSQVIKSIFRISGSMDGKPWPKAKKLRRLCHTYA